MIDDVRTALAAVRSRPAPFPGDLSLIPIGEEGVMVGVDHLRRTHLLLRASSREFAGVADIATIDVSFRPLIIGGEEVRTLDVTCLFEAVAEVFEHFIAAVLERFAVALDDASSALFNTLERWKLFLSPGAGPPSKDKIASILGELLVLRDIAGVAANEAVTTWRGPFEARHDFRRGELAVEVKTTRSHTTRRVVIHGDDQLEAPDGGEMLLHFVRLEQVPDGARTVAGEVDHLLGLGIASEPLFEALAEGGITMADLPATADVAFDVLERRSFAVDDRLPRIVPKAFVTGARPPGVQDLTYVIDLDHVLDLEVSDEGYWRMVSGLARLD